MSYNIWPQTDRQTSGQRDLRKSPGLVKAVNEVVISHLYPTNLHLNTDIKFLKTFCHCGQWEATVAALYTGGTWSFTFWTGRNGGHIGLHWWKWTSRFVDTWFSLYFLGMWSDTLLVSQIKIYFSAYLAEPLVLNCT